MTEFFLIAEIKAIYNSKGFLSIKSFTDFPERFFQLDKIYIDIFGSKKQFFVEAVKEHRSSFILKIKNFDSEEECQIFLGKKIYVDSENKVSLPNDTYFIHDLVGSKVFINNEFYGSLKDVLNMPANDIYVIHDAENNEILFPALKKYIKSFDADKKVLILEIEESFFDED